MFRYFIKNTMKVDVNITQKKFAGTPGEISAWDITTNGQVVSLDWEYHRHSSASQSFLSPQPIGTEEDGHSYAYVTDIYVHWRETKL